MTVREQIDRAVDWRKANLPEARGDIRIHVTPEDMHRALGLPRPLGKFPYPQSVLYRGYRIRATK